MKLVTVGKERFMEHDGKRVSLLESEWDHMERLKGTMIREYIGDVVLNRLRDWNRTEDIGTLIGWLYTDPHIRWESLIAPRK